MVRFYKEIYADEEMKSRINEISGAILKGEKIDSLYLIMLASNPVEQLDIYSYRVFRAALPHRRGDTLIVGMAASKGSAMELVSMMANDACKTNNDYDLRKLFKESL